MSQPGTCVFSLASSVQEINIGVGGKFLFTLRLDAEEAGIITILHDPL